MSFDQFLDPIPLPGLFVLVILLLVLCIEVGFRIGVARGTRSVKAQIAQVRAIMAMLVVGYQAGLTGKRSPIATVSMAVVFSAVIILITDLDRPRMSLFEINNQLMINLHGKMGLELGQPSDG